MRVAFQVYGPPVPKQRARKGGNGKWYTPRKTRSYERLVRSHAVQSLIPKSFPLIPTLACTRVAWSCGERYRVALAIYFPDARRRDGDNVLKSVLDACNGVLWDDDSRVVETLVTKSVDRKSPRIVVNVEALAQETSLPAATAAPNASERSSAQASNGAASDASERADTSSPRTGGDAGWW